MKLICANPDEEKARKVVGGFCQLARTHLVGRVIESNLTASCIKGIRVKEHMLVVSSIHKRFILIFFGFIIEEIINKHQLT